MPAETAELTGDESTMRRAGHDLQAATACSDPNLAASAPRRSVLGRARLAPIRLAAAVRLVLRRRPWPGALAAVLLACCCAHPPAVPSAGVAPGVAPLSSYSLVRVSFRTPSGWHELPVSRRLDAFAGRAALEALERAASSGGPVSESALGSADAGAGGPASAARRYEIRSLDADSPPLDLEQLAGADGAVRLRGAASTDAGLRSWKPLLLEVAVETLEDAMAPPRTPRGWNFVALAQCLAPEGTLPAAMRDRALERVLDAVAGLADDSAQRELCGAILPIVPGLADGALEALVARDPRTPTRVLLLTRSARRGDPAALDEILTLALEYGGPPELFARAMLVCFPPEPNPLLYATFPVETVTGRQTIPFLQHLRQHLPEARFSPSRGWQLAPS